jgi:translation elongation factor P/translation initiation factor 5A
MRALAQRLGRAAARAVAARAAGAAEPAAAAHSPWDPLAACGAWLAQRPPCRFLKTQGNEARARPRRPCARAGRLRSALTHAAFAAAAPQVRAGQVIERDGRLLEVLRAEYTQGQGRASGYVQLEARDLRSGAKRTERLRPAEAVERVQLERTEYTFSYAEGKQMVLMHPITFEQARTRARATRVRRRLRCAGQAVCAAARGCLRCAACAGAPARC